MDVGEELRAIRLQFEELTEDVRAIWERLNAQYTDLMLQLKELAADRELIDRIVVGAARNMERLYEDAKQLVVRRGKVSTWFLQHELEIGHGQAAKLIERLEEDLIVSAAEGARPRRVLVTDAAELELSEDDESESEDELYQEAKVLAGEMGRVSASYLQRKLGIGYARAARLMDRLQEHGIIEGGDGAKPRKVIASAS